MTICMTRVIVSELGISELGMNGTQQIPCRYVYSHQALHQALPSKEALLQIFVTENGTNV